MTKLHELAELGQAIRLDYISSLELLVESL